MHFLELAVQGARGFAPSVRTPLKPGYLVLKPGTGAAPPLCGLISAVLFADGRGGDVAFRAPGQETGKVGLTLLGNDQATYRIVRELGGRGGLLRLNRTSSSYERVSQDATEIAQLLRSQAGLPTKTTFEQLFTFSAAQLPSRRPKAAPAAGASGPKPRIVSSALAPEETDPSDARARIAELEREWALAEEVDQLQSRADLVASELFELENKLRSSEGLKAALTEAEAAYTQAPSAESLGLPADILQRVERYPKAVARRDEALSRLEAEQLESEALPSSVEPLYRDPRFWAGVGAGLLCLVGGMMLAGAGRYLALLDIPAFGFAAFTALRWVEDLKNAEQRTRKSEKWAVREKKIHDEFESDVQSVQVAMQTLNVDKPADIAEHLGRKGLLREKVMDFRRQLSELEQSADYAEAAERHQQLKQEQDQLNDELARKGGYVRDLREIEREMARLKESITSARSRGAPAAREAEGEPAPAAGLEDPAPALMRLGADLFQADVPAAAALIKDRCTQYLTALSERRVTGVEIGKDGRMTLLVGGKRIAASEVPARELDLAYVAMRMTLIEKYSARGKVPVLVEDTLGLEESKLPLLGRMLKHLGTVTQVLHATGHPAFEPLAGGTVSV